MSENSKLTTWMNEMDEISCVNSSFLKFAADEDEKILKIVKDPVKAISKFSYPDGSPKPEFRIEVLEGDKTEIRIWAVTNRSIMQQILGICKKEGMQSIEGSVLRVTATGSGKDRRWFLKLQQKPQGDQGATWPEGQKAGAQ